MPFAAEALVGAFAGGAADALAGVFTRGAAARVPGLTRDELAADLLDDVPDPARARTAERTGMRSPGYDAGITTSEPAVGSVSWLAELSSAAVVL